jgi:eukaryotic-like serine/threonine-protein kinase
MFLGDRYQLQDPIGRGGLATIYRGWDTHMERVVAVKVLREEYSIDPKFVTRFQREAKVMTLLHHPNIVQGYDYGQSDGIYFFVMELVEGTDLHRYLQFRGVHDINRAVIIAHDVALGLGAAHNIGIVHRDLKLQDILIGHAGSIKLIDFGLGMTLSGRLYSSPECLRGEMVTPATDVYSLGIVMYEMVTGRTPFDGDTPVAIAMQHIQCTPKPPCQLNPNIPAPLEEIILRCLEKVPGKRFRDGTQLSRALETLM